MQRYSYWNYSQWLPIILTEPDVQSYDVAFDLVDRQWKEEPSLNESAFNVRLDWTRFPKDEKVVPSATGWSDPSSNHFNMGAASPWYVVLHVKCSSPNGMPHVFGPITSFVFWFDWQIGLSSVKSTNNRLTDRSTHLYRIGLHTIAYHLSYANSAMVHKRHIITLRHHNLTKSSTTKQKQKAQHNHLTESLNLNKLLLDS